MLEFEERHESYAPKCPHFGLNWDLVRFYWVIMDGYVIKDNTVYKTYIDKCMKCSLSSFKWNTRLSIFTVL